MTETYKKNEIIWLSILQGWTMLLVVAGHISWARPLTASRTFFARGQTGALPYRSNSLDNSLLDISQLARDTGFNTDVPFEVGIKNIIEWFRNLR